MMEQRWHVFFSGQVQGVGFRYTSMRAASNRPITGWVRNLADRRVEMIAEGNADELQKFVNEVCENTFGDVTDLSVEKGPATGEFRGFEIRR